MRSVQEVKNNAHILVHEVMNIGKAYVYTAVECSHEVEYHTYRKQDVGHH